MPNHDLDSQIKILDFEQPKKLKYHEEAKLQRKVLHNQAKKLKLAETMRSTMQSRGMEPMVSTQPVNFNNL